MVKLIDTVLHSAVHEEQTYNSCNGIIHCCDGVSRLVAEEAAKTCVTCNASPLFILQKSPDRHAEQKQQPWK